MNAARAYRPRSIRTRLLLLVFAVWLPAVTAFALLARTTYLREEHAARAHIQQLADNVNSLAERELDQRVVLARTLAAALSLRDADIARFHREAVLAVRDSGSSVVLVDRERQLANTLLPQPQQLPRAEGAPFVIKKPAVFFSPRAPVLGGPVLAVVAPEQNRDPVRFNVGVAMEPAVFQSLLASQSLPEGSVISIVDAGQRVIGRSRDPQKWMGMTATGEIRRKAQAREAGYVNSVTLDGVSSLSYVSGPNAYGWAVVVALPMAALDGTARQLTLQASAAAGVLLVIGLALALYGARRISRPLVSLKQAARELGREAVPPRLRTGLSEADEVGAVLHEAGVQAQEAGRVLQLRVQEAVREAQQAQARLMDAQKHEAIGRLTGGIPHDFNNLLQTISMGLQVIERATGEGRHTRPLQAAQGACAKAADLVRQMLTFGRAQALRPQPVDVGDFLLKHQELTRKAVGERIELRATIAPGLPPLMADPTQLELALLNLVFNARDAMPEGGSITVEARLAAADEAASLPAGTYVWVAVADTGHGMDAQTLARAFEPYFTTKPVGLGSGLGLSQVLAFARQSGGDAHARSAPGQGTCIALLLPASVQPPAAPEPPPRLPQGRPLHVLMVEDDVLVSSVVVPALESQGHRVTLCRNADEATAVLAADAGFDVLFTDVVMPGSMTGLELVAWCRRERPELPAVVATGYSAQEGEPGVQVLRKPYGIAALLAALQAAAGTTTATA